MYVCMYVCMYAYMVFKYGIYFTVLYVMTYE